MSEGSLVHGKHGRTQQSFIGTVSARCVISTRISIISPTSSTTLLAVPALSATYTAPTSVGSEMMAKILL